jgi:hypothetical protein
LRKAEPIKDKEVEEMKKFKLKGLNRGISTLLDIYPAKGKYTIKNTQRPKSDSAALSGDWEKVGKTLSKAMGKDFND